MRHERLGSVSPVVDGFPSQGLLQSRSRPGKNCQIDGNRVGGVASRMQLLQTEQVRRKNLVDRQEYCRAWPDLLVFHPSLLIPGSVRDNARCPTSRVPARTGSW